MPAVPPLPSCEPFRLSKSVESEQFFGVLRAAPAEITKDLAEPLQRLQALPLNEGFWQKLPFKRPEHKEHIDLEGDAERFANFGHLLLNAYRSNGAEQLLRTLLTLRWASLQLAPDFRNKINLADSLFDLCRHSKSAASLALKLFISAEGDLGKSMCNAKVVLLLKQLERLVDAESYVAPCGLSVARLHLQNPKIPTQPWWAADDLRLPRWIRNLGRGRVARQIRSDLLQCLEGDSVAFDDSANDWFFVGSKQRWTGLNLMHSQRGGWQQQWCGQNGCARRTCERLRWRSQLNHSHWKDIQKTVGPGAPPPMYVNFYALAAGAHIIPHLGNDLRLTIHLALEVPPNNQSRIRVADTTVNYTHTGQLLIFDDAYDHEVWNDAESIRYVLGITIWHPELQKFQISVPSYNFALCWRGMKGTQTKQSKLLGTCSGRVLCTSTNQTHRHS